MKIVVTGGTGQLGKALKEYLPHALYPTRDELDLSDPLLSARIKIIDPDLIINCAAIVGKVDYADEWPEDSVIVNALAVDRMLKGMRNPSNFIQISSDYVEADNIYGQTKRLAEIMVLRDNGLVIRTSWLFGDGNNWVKWTLKNHDTPLTIVNDQISRPTYARDLAQYIVTHMDDRGELYEVQNEGQPVSWYEYAVEVCKIKGVKCAFTPISTAAYRAAHPKVAVRPMNTVMSHSAGMPDWKVSLKEYIDAYC